MENSLDSDIQMKEDVASNHDVQMWMKNNQIVYKFYEKPMVLSCQEKT